MPFVGAAAMLELERVTVGAAPIPAAPKKVPLLQTIFHVVKKEYIYGVIIRFLVGEYA